MTSATAHRGGAPASDTASRSDRLRCVLAVAGAVVTAVTGALVVAVRGDVSRLVRAAPPWTDPTRTPPSLTVVPEQWQFDGQFYYRLAIAPFSGARVVAGVSFDEPALRASRLGVGVLAYLFSVGQLAWVPWALLVVNAVGLVALAGVGAGLSASFGAHRMWGLLLIAWPGFAYTLAFDLGEIVASTFLLGAILAVVRLQAGWAAALIVGAVWTRETATLGVLALLGTWLVLAVRHQQPALRSVALRTALAGSVALAALQVFGWVRFARIPLLETLRINSGGSTTGVARALADAWPIRDRADVLALVSLALLVALLAVGAVAALSTLRGVGRVPLVVLLGWLGATAVLVLQNHGPWGEPKSFLRASTEFGLLSLLAAIAAGPRLRTVAAAVTLPVWVGTVLFVVVSEAAAVPALR